MFNKKKKKTKNKKESMQEYNAIKAKIFGNESNPKHNRNRNTNHTDTNNNNNNNHNHNRANRYTSKRFPRNTSSTLPQNNSQQTSLTLPKKLPKPQRPYASRSIPKHALHSHSHSHSSNPSNYNYHVTQPANAYHKHKTNLSNTTNTTHKYGTYIHTAHEQIYKNHNYKNPPKYDHKSSGKWKVKNDIDIDENTNNNHYQYTENPHSHRTSYYKTTYQNHNRGRGRSRKNYKSPAVPVHKQYNIFLTPRAQRTADAVLEEMKHFNKEEAVDDWWKETETKPITPTHIHIHKDKDNDKDNDEISSENKETEGNNKTINKSQIEHYLARQKAQKMMSQYHVPVAPVKLQDTAPPVDEEVIAQVCDKLQRKEWCLGSKVNIFSVSEQTWNVGKIIKISANIMEGKWKVGSVCQIYSLSQDKWKDGKVIDISFDSAGEWVKIKYRGYSKKLLLTDEDDIQYLRPMERDIYGEWLTVFYDKKEKIISRYDEYIRPVIVDGVDGGDVVEELRERALQYLAENPQNLDSDDESVENRKLAMKSVQAVLKDVPISDSRSPVVDGDDGDEVKLEILDVMQTDLSVICWEFNSLTGCKKGSKCKWKHEYVNGEIKQPDDGEIVDGIDVEEVGQGHDKKT